MKKLYLGMAALAAVAVATPAISSAAEAHPRPGFSLYFGFGDGWHYDRAPRYKRGQEQVCLVTFFKKSQVEAGADKNVQRARYLPRHEARRRDGPHDQQRIFDYGSNRETRETCRYLNRINN